MRLTLFFTLDSFGSLLELARNLDADLARARMIHVGRCRSDHPGDAAQASSLTHRNCSFVATGTSVSAPSSQPRLVNRNPSQKLRIGTTARNTCEHVAAKRERKQLRCLTDRRRRRASKKAEFPLGAACRCIRFFGEP